MRIILAVFAFLAFAASARADELSLRADPQPIVEATVNGQPVKLLVDLLLPDVMVLSPEAGARLNVRPLPGVAARVVIDDASIRARIARPKISFANGKSSRAFAGLFGGTWKEGVAGVDGAIGPGVLPYDRVRIVMRDTPARVERRFTLTRPDVWTIDARLANEPAGLAFDLTRRATVLNRPASRFLDANGKLSLDGGVERTPFFLGLSATTQRVRPEGAILGFAFGPTIARTDAPLIGNDAVDVVVVTGDAKRPRPRTVWLGRDALQGCSEFDWRRREKTLTLRCD